MRAVNKPEERNYEITDGIGILEISGMIMPESEMCAEVAGTKDLAETLKEMIADPNVKSIVFKLNSGGGDSYAPHFLTEVMDSSPKRIDALVYTVCASACYKIAVHCDSIYAHHESSQIGSIGTMLSIIDDRAALESEGIKEIDIYATQSTNKNLEYREFLNGNFSLIEKRLEKAANFFIEEVQKNRPQILETALDGLVFYAKDAQKQGLIDGILNENNFFKMTKSNIKKGVVERLRNKVLESLGVKILDAQEEETLENAQESIDKFAELQKQMEQMKADHEEEVNEYVAQYAELHGQKEALNTRFSQVLQELAQERADHAATKKLLENYENSTKHTTTSQTKAKTREEMTFDEKLANMSEEDKKFYQRAGKEYPHLNTDNYGVVQ
jgi:protease-4